MMKKCVLCGHPYENDCMTEVIVREGLAEEICRSCYWDTEECPECGERVVPEEGYCPNCYSEV